METKTYSLRELPKINIDSFVNAISEMCDYGWPYEEAQEHSDEAEIKQWRMMDCCPGELEPGFLAVAARNNFRFDADGRVVSFERAKERD